MDNGFCFWSFCGLSKIFLFDSFFFFSSTFFLVIRIVIGILRYCRLKNLKNDHGDHGVSSNLYFLKFFHRTGSFDLDWIFDQVFRNGRWNFSSYIFIFVILKVFYHHLVVKKTKLSHLFWVSDCDLKCSMFCISNWSLSNFFSPITWWFFIF